MKGKHIVKILMFTLILGLLFTGCVRINNKDVSVGKSIYRYDDADRYSIGDGSVPASRVKDLEIDWLSGNVSVVYGSGSEVTIAESFSGNLSQDQLVRWYLDGSTLRIKFQKSGIVWGDTGSKDLTVVLPRGMALDELDMDCVSADFNVEVDASEYDVESVSGDFNLSASGSRSVDVGTVSGDCNLRMQQCPSNVDMKSVSGSISLWIPSDSGFTAEISTVSGKINCSIPVTTSGKRIVAGNGSAEIEMESVSGDLNIYPN